MIIHFNIKVSQLWIQNMDENTINTVVFAGYVCLGAVSAISAFYLFLSYCQKNRFSRLPPRSVREEEYLDQLLIGNDSESEYSYYSDSNSSGALGDVLGTPQNGLSVLGNDNQATESDSYDSDSSVSKTEHKVWPDPQDIPSITDSDFRNRQYISGMRNGEFVFVKDSDFENKKDI